MKDKIANTPDLLKYNSLIPIAIAFFATVLIATMACGSNEEGTASAATGSIDVLNVGSKGYSVFPGETLIQTVVVEKGSAGFRRNRSADRSRRKAR